LINTKQLKDLVIEPTLMEMGPEFQSPYAVALLVGTAAQESRMGEFLVQLGGGPALGIFQMEPDTYYDIWDHFIDYRPHIQRMIVRVCPGDYGHRSMRQPGGEDLMRVLMAPDPKRLVYDLRFATLMARLHYYRVSKPLPKTPQGYAAYWKLYYNTELGAGTQAEFLHNWGQFC